MYKKENTQGFEPFYTFTKKKKIALWKAILDQDLEKIRNLFTIGKKKKDLFVDEEYDDEHEHEIEHGSALQFAYRNGKMDALITLMECGVHPEESQYYLKSSFLEDLIREGNLEMIKRILPYVKNISDELIFTMEGYQIRTTHLGLCACLGKVEEAKLLMDRGFRIKPPSTREALERNEEHRGTYRGSINEARGTDPEYYGPWEELMLEPWQFAVLCGDREAASWFFQFGEDQRSLGFSKVIFCVRKDDILELLQERFPKQMKEACGKRNVKSVLETANGELLKRMDLEDCDISSLGIKCVDEDRILDCYNALKARLPRELNMEEKRRLVRLMLQRKCEKMIGICEAEWASETELCDITEWVAFIPRSGPSDKEFIKALERSSLKLCIHPESAVFDERHYYFDEITGVNHVIWCLNHVKNLAILDKLVTVIPPEDLGDELLPFTEKVLDIGKKTAFQRLKKWGLVTEKNMDQVAAYILEQNLEQYYDQAIQSGEGMKNRKTYDL